MKPDVVSAWDEHAEAFLAVRDHSDIGADVVDRWARSLGAGAEVLEIGCGGGLPISRALVDAGVRLQAIESSPTLAAVFSSRFPEVPLECARAMDSACFQRTFDAVVAVGLVFLLPDDEQVALIHRVGELLEPGGRFLFTSPDQVCRWQDMTTGLESRSLGRDRYESLLADAGLRVIATFQDAGGNHYFDAERVSPTTEHDAN